MGALRVVGMHVLALDRLPMIDGPTMTSSLTTVQDLRPSAWSEPR